MKIRQLEGVIDIINQYGDAKKVTSPEKEVKFNHDCLTYTQCLSLMEFLSNDLDKLKKHGINKSNIATLALNLNDFVVFKFTSNKKDEDPSLGWYKSEQSFNQLLQSQSSYYTHLWHGNSDAMKKSTNGVKQAIAKRYPEIVA